MARHQAQALRTVLGPYKATPVCSLELDAFCPPLDIYLSKRVADFERRMQFSGLDIKLSRATAYIEAKLRARRLRRDRKRLLEGAHWEWARDWTGSTGHPDDPWDSKAAAVRDWEARWVTHNHSASARADTTVAAKAFEGGHLRLYEKLNKAEGGALPGSDGKNRATRVSVLTKCAGSYFSRLPVRARRPNRSSFICRVYGQKVQELKGGWLCY